MEQQDASGDRTARRWANHVVRATLLVLLLGSGQGPWSHAATQAEVDAAWVRGLAWLLTHQNPDGSWGAQHGTEVAATATTVEVLHRLGLRNHAYLFGVAWLANAETGSVDSRARKVVGLRTAGHDVSADLATLSAWRKSTGGWGAYSQLAASFPDTALAARAVQDLNGGAVCNILYAQKQSNNPEVNGSWSYLYEMYAYFYSERLASTSASALVPTVVNIQALQELMTSSTLICYRHGWATETYTKANVLNSAIAWLLGQRRHSDGGFGDEGASTAFETGLVYEVLRVHRPTESATLAALEFLLAHQDDWYRDAFHAATILRTLPDPGPTLFVDTNNDSVPDTMIDTDGDGVPDAVEAYLQQSPSTPDSRWLANPYDGDLNQDGVVDAADVALADLIASGQLAATVVHLRHGDVAPPGAPDGVVDVADVIRIQGKALGLEAF